MNTPVLEGNESELWSSEVFTQTVKSAGNDLSSELIPFTFTQQMHAHVRAFQTSTIKETTRHLAATRATSFDLL